MNYPTCNVHIHEHKWDHYKDSFASYRVGFDAVYRCKCGMERRDRVIGLANQRKLWEWHYFPALPASTAMRGER